jgi:hypothetical protein
MRQTIGTENALYSVSFTDANIGTAVGWLGTILHTNTGGVTAVKEHVTYTLPTSFRLMQNYPNPFNPSTIISFNLSSKSFVTLKVYDLLGREVATIVSEELPAGNYTRQWNASSLPSGIYFYRLQTSSFTDSKKLILLR